MIRLIDFEKSDPHAAKAAYVRVTPKRFAQYQLACALDGYLESQDLEAEYPEMTERERALVDEQFRKVAARLYDVLHMSMPSI